MSRRRWADRILDRALPDGPSGHAIRGDLRQERQRRTARNGRRAADRWYLRQSLSIWLWSTRDRLTGVSWRSGRRISNDPEGAGGFVSDLRYGLRVLRRAPGYSAAVIVTLGVAMAATVSVFTVIRGVLLRDLPYPEPDRLVRIDRLDDDGPRNGGVDYPTFLDWQARIEGLAQMAVYGGSEGVFVGDGFAEVWRGTAGSRDLLGALGVHPMLGSFYGPAEGVNGEQTIYLSHEIWERRFGADPEIVGRSIDFYEQSWVVRGVMSRDFSFLPEQSDYWIPLRESPFLDGRGSGFLRGVARLSSDVSLAAAAEELAALNAAINEEHGMAAHDFVMRGVADVERAPVRRVLWIFMGAVGFFLLVACANVAGLTLARTESRRQELSIRLSLGASRGRLTRQVLAESTVLAMLGGGLGLLGAVGGVRALLALAPADLPRREAVAIDPLVVGFALVVALTAGVLLGTLPGLRGARIASARPSASRSHGRRSRRTHRALAGAQVALAVVLLTGSGLLLRSFGELSSVETGFLDPSRLLMVEMGLGRDDYQTAEQILSFHRRFFDGLSELPGVVHAGLSTHLPFSRSRIQASVVRDGEIYRSGQVEQLGLEMVNGDYRQALGLPLLRGRDFSDNSDGATPLREVLINEAGAELLWPGQDPMGMRFSFDVDEGQLSAEDTYYTVVGLVPDVMDVGLDQEVRARAYYDLSEFRRQYGFITGRFFYAVIRSTGDPYALVDAVRDFVHRLDPQAPVRSFASLEQMIRDTTVPARFRTVTLTVFAALAVLVALLGVYGVMAYGVATSVREIGVRMALGAGSSAVRDGVLRQALWVVSVGGLVGVLTAGVISPVLESMLFQVSERDPLTLVAVLAAAIVAALAAAYLPALRASRIDPMRVLRQD